LALAPASKIWRDAGALALLAALLTLAGLFARSARAAEDPLPIKDYWELAHHSQATVAALAGLPDEQVRAQLADLANQWEAVRQVRLSDDLVAPVDHRSLVEQLRSRDPDLEAIQEYLTALADGEKYWMRDRFSADELHALTAILSRRVFQWQEHQPSALERWWRGLVDRLAAWLTDLFGDRQVEIPGWFSGWMLPGAGLLLVLLAFGFIYREMRQSLAGEAILSAEADLGAEVYSSNGAFQKAMDLSQGGDTRSAVRYLFLSALLVLDERSLLHYDRAKTNREYLRSLRDRPDLAQQLRGIVEVFDRVWYGYQPIEAPAFAQFVSQVEKLREGH
jgi:hypothetical protein